MNKGVGNVEEEVQPETENIQASVSGDTGGVFWINSLEKECRQCGEEFQTPKRTIRGDGSWRNRRTVEERPIQTSNRLAVWKSLKRMRGQRSFWQCPVALPKERALEDK